MEPPEGLCGAGRGSNPEAVTGATSSQTDTADAPMAVGARTFRAAHRPTMAPTLLSRWSGSGVEWSGLERVGGRYFSGARRHRARF
jgi:hypothetical protein